MVVNAHHFYPFFLSKQNIDKVIGVSWVGNKQLLLISNLSFLPFFWQSILYLSDKYKCASLTPQSSAMAGMVILLHKPFYCASLIYFQYNGQRRCYLENGVSFSFNFLITILCNLCSAIFCPIDSLFHVLGKKSQEFMHTH